MGNCDSGLLNMSIEEGYDSVRNPSSKTRLYSLRTPQMCSQRYARGSMLCDVRTRRGRDFRGHGRPSGSTTVVLAVR